MKFSIITPTYNRSKVLERPIKSTVNQNYTNWELIVVDDGSSDDTSVLIGKYVSDKVRYIHYFENRGVNYARNHGIKEATGDYLIFLDSDDEFISEKALDIVKGYLEKVPNGDVYIFGSVNQEGKKMYSFKEEISFPSFSDLINGEKGNGELLYVVKQSVFKELLFIEELNGFEGITWLEIAKRNIFVFINEALRVYWQDTESITRPKNLNRNKLLNAKKGFEIKLDRHGSELKKHNLKGYEGYVMTLANLAKAEALLGDKKSAFKHTMEGLALNPIELRLWRNLMIMCRNIN